MGEPGQHLPCGVDRGRGIGPRSERDRDDVGRTGIVVWTNAYPSAFITGVSVLRNRVHYAEGDSIVYHYDPTSQVDSLLKSTLAYPGNGNSLDTLTHKPP